jgi:hypothetical protein
MRCTALIYYGGFALVQLMASTGQARSRHRIFAVIGNFVFQALALCIDLPL